MMSTCGLLMIIFAAIVQSNTAWLEPFFELDGTNDSLISIVKSTQKLMYLVGFYSLFIGLGGFLVVKKAMAPEPLFCYKIIYAFFLPPVIVLMMIIAAPIFIVNSVSEESINKFCAISAMEDPTAIAT